MLHVVLVSDAATPFSGWLHRLQAVKKDPSLVKVSAFRNFGPVPVTPVRQQSEERRRTVESEDLAANCKCCVVQHDPNMRLPTAGLGALFTAGAAASSGYGYRQLAASTGGLDANIMTADWSRACYEAVATATVGYRWLPLDGPAQQPILEYTESQICATALNGNGGNEGESSHPPPACYSTLTCRPFTVYLRLLHRFVSCRLPSAVQCRGRRFQLIAEL